MRHIPQTELTRNPESVFNAVRRGEPVVVEPEGKPAAAIVDYVDFQILLAAIRHYLGSSPPDPDAGLPDSAVADLSGQPRFDVVISHYLTGAISLSRTAELLGTAWLDLRTRISRLGMPLRTAPIDAEGAMEDALVAESFAS